MKKFLEYKVRGSILFSIIFGFGYVLGYQMVIDESQDFTLISVLEGMLWSAINYLLFCVAKWLFSNQILRKEIPYIRKFKEHSYRNSFLVFISAWIAHLLIKYPGGNCFDSYYQIQQGLGNVKLTTHHPLVHTLILGNFVKFGDFLFGSKNMGLFLFVTVEAIVMAFIFSYAVSNLVMLEFPDLIVVLSVGFFSFSPYIFGYIGQPIKDVYYSAGFVLLIIQLTKYLFQDDFFDNILNSILLIIASMLIDFCRNEGILLLVPTFLLVAGMEIYKRRKIGRWFVVLLIAILLPTFIKIGLEKSLNPDKGSKSQILSLPIQQTARYVKYYPELVSDDEKKAISNLLPYEKIADLYNEDISDPLKREFNRDVTTEEIIEYLHAWFKGFLKKPFCYIRATTEQNIYLIYPGFNNYTYYLQACNNWKNIFKGPPLFTKPVILQKAENNYMAFLSDMHTFPVLNIINNMVFYVWLLCVSFLLLINQKKKKILTIFLPLFLSLAIIILAPCIRGHVRYTFPVIWSFPIWFGIMFHE